MAIFKCKICGGTLEIGGAQSVATCEYCGTKQTLPKLDDDRKANLYDRANHFRRNNDFDKAMGIYENILNEDNTDAEAYWSLVLCRYGIEYVEDPATHKRVPTVNRAQFTSVFDDEDYKSALQYADGYQREIYEAEATAINEIQKGILAISQKEEPFDVFVCYKETDANGRRTQDSVLATELYHELTREGFKVFFSRITLEDKLGIAYEPYIFAALNSAKVMVVLGTRPEHFNAVWVKNEWSRYLALIKNGAKKTLIPAYRDMDPYDLPEEFSHLQAQDMSKLGFMQDLTRGIKKIVAADAPKTIAKETVIATATTPNIAPLLKRAFMFLEDGDFDRADDFCEQVLNQDPENAEAYLGKLMVELKVSQRKNLGNLEFAFDKEKNYLKVLRYGDEVIRTELQGYIKTIYKRNEDKFREEIYQKARKKQSNALDKISLEEAVELYDKIINYKDSREQKEICQSKIQYIKQQEAEREERLKEQVKAREEKDILQTDIKYKKHKILFTCAIVFLIVSPLLLILACFSPTPTLALIFIFLFFTDLLCIAVPFQKYRYVKAKKYYYDKKYFNAADIFEQMEGNPHNKFMDVSTWKRKSLIAAGDTSYIAYSNYKKKQRRKEKFIIAGITAAVILAIALVLVIIFVVESVIIPNKKYNKAIGLLESGNYVDSYEALIELNGYKDSAEKANSIYETYKTEKLKTAKVGDCILFGSYEQDNNTQNGRENIEWLVLETKDNKVLVVSKYALDRQPYNEHNAKITWETCTLRKWLNNEFINTAFSDSEKTAILTVTVSADKNTVGTSDPGNATQDKVFLLSITEANKYFSSDSDRKCDVTTYAEARETYSSDGMWWLRSPGEIQYVASTVYNSGSVNKFGKYADDSLAIRPALWIDLEGEMFQ
ncbi:MAG: TIR domain-containing protein [Clostridia bacterium]|nr:TIR domain-containing protein [Clostridia bacterium]